MIKILKGFWIKIFGLLILTILSTVLVISIGIIISQSIFIEKYIIEKNIILAETISEAIRIGYLNFSWPLEILKKISDFEETVFLWLVKPTGEIFFSNESLVQGKIISEKLLIYKTYKIVDRNYQGQKIKVLIFPLKLEAEKKPWYLFLGFSLKSIEAARKKILFDSILILFFIIPLSFFGSFYFSRSIVEPLEILKEGAESIGEGNFDHKILIDTNDELEDLANVFNSMIENLKKARSFLEENQITLQIRVDAKTHQLKELVEHLEDRIKERTKELEQRLEELEKFHHLTVTRELRMIELKREIEKLKAEIRKKKS